MQQYLTLEEAAKFLQMSPDELREMAKKKTVRAFQDRGTWRFRSQDIEELARSRGLSSDIEMMTLGEGANPPSGSAKRPANKPSDSDLLPADFTLDESEEVPLGREKHSPKPGQKSPKPSSDSDVRLVMDGDPDLKADAGKSGTGKKKAAGDSGVRLVPPASDSDVRLEQSDKDSGARRRASKSPSDSDIRLDEAEPPKKRGQEVGQVTEEIDLDAEAAKAKPQAKKKPGKPTQMAGNRTQLPGASPFELSDSEMEVAPKKPTKPTPQKKKSEVDSSSDFELIPFDSSKSPVELGSGDIPLLEGSEEDVNLGSEVSGQSAGASGINLKGPADSGISLEDGGSDEIEFELSLEEGSTPKPSAKSATRQPASSKAAPKSNKGQKAPPKAAKAPAPDDSSSEFDLSLEEDSSPMDNSSSEFELSLEDESPTSDSSSEFELSLDDSSEESPKEGASDSEFELTLDDEGALAVDEEAGDIFEETNFDVPALEDESGSEAVAIDESDTDLEGSDFEISLDDDSSAGDDSESQVVALEDEEADDAAATVARPRKTASKSAAKSKAAFADDDLDVDVGDLPKSRKTKTAVVDEDDLDDEEGVPAAAEDQDWGALPAAVLFPTVLVMFFVCIMGFELGRGMYGYHRGTAIGKPVIDFIASKVSDDTLPK